MGYTGWLYELTVILYAISVLFYFIDFIQHNRKLNRWAFGLLGVVWVLQSTYFVRELVRIGQFPVLTPEDGLFFYAWVLVTLSLVIHLFFRIGAFSFFVHLFGFMVMAIYLFAPNDYKAQVLQDQLMSGLLIVHITLAFIAYASFTVSFIFSSMYLIEHRLLKKKKWVEQLFRFGSLFQLEKATYWLNMIGVPMLLLSLILGEVWASITLDTVYLFDAKVILPFLVIIVYSLLLYVKVIKGVHGRKLMVWNTMTFMMVLINYVWSDSLTNFHLFAH